MRPELVTRLEPSRNNTPEFLALIASLRAAGLVHSPAPKLQPLTGGISSEILLVDDDGRKLVVKRALAKMRVRDDWFADTSRSRSELAYLYRAAAIVPGSMPRVLFAPPNGEWFAMEYLGDGFANWKSMLLVGQAERSRAREAGTLLGRIHRGTWRDPEVARDFATLDNFRQLRLDPYLATTAQRLPDLARFLLAEQDRLASTALALVHGDFSPKNILLSPDRFVLLDAEVAWFGDPAFDTAFLLCHFCLKALLHSNNPDPFLELTRAFWEAYTVALEDHSNDELEERTAHLLLCLMLARVHGKSPVEYLNAAQQAKVTGYVRAHMGLRHPRLASLAEAWRETVLS